MSRKDYEAISKIIEEVVGKDTLTGVKLLEGIKFYIDNRVEEIKIIRDDNTIRTTKSDIVSAYKKEADNAMKRYTEKLIKENEKYKKRKKPVKETCSVTG
tara:strand:+ start:1297 stop:1596 length:300 start_codon:yes stop_codon:yes gene_type:complete